MASLSRAEAQKVLEDIRLDSARLQLGNATRALPMEIYFTDARFVYELVQNAEENRYHDGALKYLSFDIQLDKLVVESNEIGFDIEDVKAICGAGDGRKVAEHGPISQKGIGFKSVFKVAKKAKIQSGPFSFALEHTWRTDFSGRGLVTPLQQTYDDLPCEVGTRMTLSFMDNIWQRTLYLKDLLQVPDSILWFLTKLDEICITNDIECQEQIVTSYSIKKDGVGPRKQLQKTITTPSMIETETTYAYVFEKEIRDLAPHDTRPGSTGRVAVAFPVDADDTPITALQHMSTHLPLDRDRFKFLIKGDFVTQDHGQRTVDCDRNEQLLDGMAHAFKEAVQWFALHRKLAYTWARWLPEPGEITNKFWRRLVDKIVRLLQQSKILYSWSDSALCRPDTLHTLDRTHQDSTGQPLFKDIPGKEAYLSQRYDLSCVLALKPLGVSCASHDLLLDKLEADLERPDSVYKASSTEQDWHDRAAQGVLLALELASPLVSWRPRHMYMIPLDSEVENQGYNSWVTASSGPLFFPRLGLSNIPMDIGMRLVDAVAAAMPDRQRMFRALGVSICSVEDVIQKLYDKYARGMSRPVPMWNVCSHTRFLFEHAADAGDDIRNKMFLYTESMSMVWRDGRQTVRLYFGDLTGPLDAPQLLRNGFFGATLAMSSKHVHFLCEDYLLGYRDNSERARAMRRWLAETFDIQSTICLQHHSRPGLSEEFLFIRQHHSHRLLELLQKNWLSYRPVIHLVSAELRSTLVPMDPGIARSMPLESGYLPLPRLKSIVERAGISTNSLFLRIPQVVRDEDVSHWKFLSTLGVGIRDDVRFYLTLLRRQAQLSPSPAKEQIRHIYERLAETCSGEQDKHQIINCFSSTKLVYCAGPAAGATPEWVHLRDCVWSGPEWSTSKIALATIWPSLELLFRAVLKVADFSWKDCLVELESIKSSGSYNTTMIIQAYQWLERDFRHFGSCRELQEELKKRELIFVPHENRWTSLSSCLWAQHTIRVPHQFSIGASYLDLEHFFTNMLGVQRPDLSRHVQELKQLARGYRKLDNWQQRFKESMRLVNSLNPKARDLKPLLGANILPVRLPSGEVKPTSSRVEFAIVDREEYNGIFKDCNILAFSLSEVNAFRPFLLAMGLRAKYMSELVQERTTATDSVLSRTLTRLFWSRAYAIFRCAVAFGSPKAAQANQALLRQLRQAEVLLSDNMWKTSTLTQNGREHVAKQQRATLHISQTDDCLRIHIPRNEDDRELCYFTTLPSRLRRFLEIADPTAERILVAILRCIRLDNVDKVLQDAGIAEIEGLSRRLEQLYEIEDLNETPPYSSIDFGISSSSEDLAQLPKSPTTWLMNELFAQS